MKTAADPTDRRPRQGSPRRQADAISGSGSPPLIRFVLIGDLLFRLDAVGLLAILAVGRLVAVTGLVAAGIRVGALAVAIGLMVAVQLSGLVIAVAGFVLVAVTLVLAILAVMVVAIVVAVAMVALATFVASIAAVAAIVIATLAVAALAAVVVATVATPLAAIATAITTITTAVAFGIGGAEREMHEVAAGRKVPWREDGAHRERRPRRGANETLLPAHRDMPISSAGVPAYRRHCGARVLKGP